MLPSFSVEKLPSYLLFTEQARLGHKIRIISYNSEKRVKTIPIAENLVIYLLPGLNMPFPQKVANPYLFNFSSFVNRLDSDILHVHQLLKLTALSTAMACRRTKTPFVVTIHGVVATSGSLIEASQRDYYRSIGKLICKKSSRVICLTETDASQMMNLGCPPEKIRVVPNGVDCSRFKPDGSVIDNTIFWGGRFVPQKGLQYLIEALKLVTKKNPDVKLILTGDGVLFPKITKLVHELGLSGNVVFKGSVPFDDLPRIINSASMCVLPSLMEGMPRALLEVMACGKPVVSCDIPGINDVITHNKNGLLVPPRNSLALAEAIFTLLREKDLQQKLGQNARQLMFEKYSWRMVNDRIEKVYSEAIDECA